MFPFFVSVGVAFQTPAKSGACCSQTKLRGVQQGCDVGLEAPCALQTCSATSWQDSLGASGFPSLGLSFPTCEMEVMLLLSSGSAGRRLGK